MIKLRGQKGSVWIHTHHDYSNEVVISFANVAESLRALNHLIIQVQCNFKYMYVLNESVYLLFL